MSIQFLDRELRLPSSPEQLLSRFEFDHWMMTDAERATLTLLLQELRPECVIEIGTYRAGSLAVLARHSRKVYSLDIDPACKENYADQFSNVEFITGRSDSTLPSLLEKIRDSGEVLQFVLIDGSHIEDEVRGDINALLTYKPAAPLYVIMHDSFNPQCRSGIRSADWAASPYVHLVELDYVCGQLMSKDEGSAYREMWCGFGLGILLPEPRSGALVIHENESMIQQVAYWRSVYPYENLRAWFRRQRERLQRLRRKIIGF